MTVFTARFGFKWNYAPHDTGWGTDYNFAHRELAAVLHPYIQSDIVTEPPALPVENISYFVPTSAAGVWAGHALSLAVYQGGDWRYYSLEAGTRAYFVNHAGFYWWTGSAWQLEATSGGGGAGVRTVAGHLPDIDGNVTLVVGDIAGAAPSSSPTFTGNPTATTQAAGNNSTRLATTEYVDRAVSAVVTGGSFDFANANLSGLPTSDPGGGKPWLNGGVLQVGA